MSHDWGGAAAWAKAMNHPEVVDRLAILKAAHPRKRPQDCTTSEGTNFLQFVGRVDGRGGFAVIETEDPTLIARGVAIFSPFAEYSVSTPFGHSGVGPDRRRSCRVPPQRRLDR